MPAQLPVDASEQPRTETHREVSGHPAQSVEGLGPLALLDLSLDRAPEQVEDLRDHDHRGDPMVAERIEDDARIAAAHVEDVGPDIERVVQPDGLLQQVRERQERHDPMLHRRDDPME